MWGRISTTCVMSVWGNDINCSAFRKDAKCKYRSVFLQNILVYPRLSDTLEATIHHWLVAQLVYWNLHRVPRGMRQTAMVFSEPNDSHGKQYSDVIMSLIGVLNQQRLNYLLNSLFRHRPKKTSKLCITGLCEGNSPVTSEFPTKRASNAENVSIWWCYHDNTKNPWHQVHPIEYGHGSHFQTCKLIVLE